MKLALQEAEVAFQEGEIPVGAIVVWEGRIVGRGHNQVETLNDPTAHAEIIALGAAATALQSWRLCDCDLYVTLEPCSMCAGAAVTARVHRLVFGAFNPQEGACGSLWNIVQDQRLEHQLELTSGVLKRECEAILKSFFAELRQAKE
jgi:tRNA(adenine34) deaminase